MDPLSAMAIASVVSAGAQWYNSDQARSASKEDRAAMARLVSKLKDPNFDMSKFEPEEFKLVGKYIPEVAPQVAEANPTLLQETGDTRFARQAQLDALREMRTAALSDKDPILGNQLDLASRAAQAEAQSRQASTLQDANRRGQGGSLATLVAQMGGASDAADRNSQLAQQAAIEAYKSKLQNLRGLSDMGSNLRQEDFNVQGKNMDAINSFNQRTSANAQNYLKYAAGERNDAQRANLSAAQSAADNNVGLRNSAQQYNQKYGNDMLQQQYQNQANKIGLQSGQIQQGIQARSSDAADRNQAIQGVTNIGAAYADRSDSRVYDQQKLADERTFRAEQAELDRQARERRGY